MEKVQENCWHEKVQILDTDHIAEQQILTMVII